VIGFTLPMGAMYRENSRRRSNSGRYNTAAI